MLEYHKNCTEILQSLTVKLYEKINEASARPKAEFHPKTLEDLGLERINSVDNLGTLNILDTLNSLDTFNNLERLNNLLTCYKKAVHISVEAALSDYLPMLTAKCFTT